MKKHFSRKGCLFRFAVACVMAVEHQSRGKEKTKIQLVALQQ